MSLAQSAEIVLNLDSQPAPTARAKVLLELPPAAEAELAAELDRLREAAPTAPKTLKPPDEFVEKPRLIPWRVARIVSDLKAVPVSREPGPGGGPPPPGGAMMGGQ